MALVEIKFRPWTGKASLSVEVGDDVKPWLRIKVALEIEVAKANAEGRRADLSGADLSRADLRDAVLSRADLSRADLSRAVLRDADLSDADLSDADLRGADLSRADLSRAVLSGADLSRADLSRAVLSGAVLRDADLSDADLSDADLREILEKVPLIPNIDAAILEAIEKNKASGTNGLDMNSWHGDTDKANEAEWCQTTHCRAGYAICLAGKEGFELERRFGPANAGMLLYLKSTPNEPIPNWTASNESAMRDMRERAARQTGKGAA